jgi:hypothetical protein
LFAAIAVPVLLTAGSAVSANAQAAGTNPAPAVDYDEDTILRADLARKLKSCRGHETELERLLKTGIRDDMARGLDWARANLSKERMSEIRRFLEAEEQVRFRCGEVFAAVSVIRAEQEARRRAAIEQARQRAYEARLAEQLARIQPPERKPERFRRTARTVLPPARQPGVPPLPVRRIR